MVAMNTLDEQLNDAKRPNAFALNRELTTLIYEVGTGMAIASTLHPDFACYSAKQAEANAEFIVRACNSHYDLVAALKEAGRSLETFRRHCPSPVTWTTVVPGIEGSVSYEEMIDWTHGQIKAALAKAEKGAA